jgi:uncharacterized protein YdeI (YjbR/CyaY-like superfamily)
VKRPVKTKGKPAAKTFEATLERLRSNLGWTIVFIPFDVPKLWGARGNLRVKGDINGFPFRTSLFPTREGRHFLLINKKMQAGAGVQLGSVAEIRLEPDTEKRVATVPPELRSAISQDGALLKWFGQLNYSMRKWISDQVTQPRSVGARVRRAEQIAEQLMCAMEAESELPPLLKLAFSREPEALRGWNLMTPLKRRGELLAIFHYRTPDARDRRIEKTMVVALAMAERKARG